MDDPVDALYGALALAAELTNPQHYPIGVRQRAELIADGVREAIARLHSSGMFDQTLGVVAGSELDRLDAIDAELGLVVVPIDRERLLVRRAEALERLRQAIVDRRQVLGMVGK